MIDLRVADLKRLCQAPGCPMCTARRQAERRYIEGMLWEGVSDGHFRAKLKRSLGFCPDHAWRLQATEDTHWRDGLGSSLVYQDLIRQVVETLAGYDPSRPRGSGIRGWLAGVLRNFWPLPRSTLALLERLRPQQMCPVCEIRQEAEQRFIHTLLDNFQTDETQTAFCHSGGLCLDHLRQVLAQASPPAAAFLVNLTLERLQPLLAELAEYERKHAWRFRDEAKIEREEHAWVRAVAFFAGEAAEAELERIAARRRQALTMFHTEKQERCQ